MRTSRTCRSGLLAMMLLVVPAMAGELGGRDRVEAVVTAVTGPMVFLGRGSEAGIEIGDEVELVNPERQRTIAGRVRAVTANTCRVQLETSTSGLSVGDRGDVLISDVRSLTEQEAAGAREHPPWEHPPLELDPSVPLLAETQRFPGDSDVEVDGRVFTNYFYNEESQYGDRSYQSSTTGVDMRLVNPYRKGGTLDVRVDFASRRAGYATSEDVDDTYLRVERLSYAWGGFRGQAVRGEVGRFLQHEFPEFGVLDGVELGHGLASGSRIGASVGHMPIHDDRLTNGEDIQAAVFYRYVSGDKEKLTLGTGYQKTWHAGKEDRDLIVSTAEYHPRPRIFLYGGAWIDYYTSRDDAKSEGLELTRLQLNGSYRWDAGHGIGLLATHNRWPEMLRNEYAPITAIQTADMEVTRVGINGWYRPMQKMRIYGRVDRWEDSEDDGNNGELTVSLRDVLYQQGEISAGVYSTTGSYVDTTGFRVSANRRLGRGLLDLRWISSDFEQHDSLREWGDMNHQMVRLGYNTRIGEAWDMSVYAEDRYGDQDSLSVGFYLQRRF